MGEWSDYFEDFPEENPANWVNGAYACPQAAQAHRKRQFEAKRMLRIEQAKLNGDISRMIAEGNARAMVKNAQ